MNGSKSFSCIIYLLNYEGSKADGEHKRLRDEGNNCLQTKKSWIHRRNQFTSSGHSFNSFWISSSAEIHTAIITISQIFIATHEKSGWIEGSWRMWDFFWWIFLSGGKFQEYLNRAKFKLEFMISFFESLFSNQVKLSSFHSWRQFLQIS